MKVQVALQGGGAKLMALLAAMETVEGFEGKIRVTRLAGTSAGSIVACLFALGFSMRQIRIELQGKFGQEILAAFPPAGWFTIARRNRAGRSLWDMGVLRKWLQKKVETEKGITRFEDLEKEGAMPFEVSSTDLRSGGVKHYAESDNVVEAVLDSCAIPFFFRSWNIGGAGTLHVDGGMCENLPVWKLKAGEKEMENGDLKWGRAIAFSFEPETPGLPGDICDFTRALISTSIDNTVYRAKQALGADSVHEIKTILKTFDFKTALTPGEAAVAGVSPHFLNSSDCSPQAATASTRCICLPIFAASPLLLFMP